MARPSPRPAAACASRSIARCAASITAANDCGSRRRRARSRRIRRSSLCPATCWPMRRSYFGRHCRKKRMPRAACRSGLPTSCSWRSPMPRVRTEQPRVRPHRPRRDRQLSDTAVRPADDRGLFRRQPCRRARSGRRARFLRFRGVGIDRPARQRFCAPAVADTACIAGAPIRSRAVPIPMRCRAWPDCRAALAAPVDDRLFFAGEACSQGDFSTAHGGFHTGVVAADAVIALRPGKHV